MLKPCPFCGSKIIYQSYYDDKYGYKTPIVFCDICKATLEVEDAIRKMNLLLEHLEDNDDVQNVYHNWDMPDTDEEE